MMLYSERIAGRDDDDANKNDAVTDSTREDGRVPRPSAQAALSSPSDRSPLRRSHSDSSLIRFQNLLNRQEVETRQSNQGEDEAVFAADKTDGNVNSSKTDSKRHRPPPFREIGVPTNRILTRKKNLLVRLLTRNRMSISTTVITMNVSPDMNMEQQQQGRVYSEDDEFHVVDMDTVSVLGLDDDPKEDFYAYAVKQEALAAFREHPKAASERHIGQLHQHGGGIYYTYDYNDYLQSTKERRRRKNHPMGSVFYSFRRSFNNNKKCSRSGNAAATTCTSGSFTSISSNSSHQWRKAYSYH